MRVRIYRPAKNAMQSGQANTRGWVLESAPEAGKIRDPLMGWTGSVDTDCQWRLAFDTKEAAIAYAERRGLNYHVEEPHKRRMKIKSYADNFRWQRPG